MMNSDRRNWSTAAMGRQAPMADQVVLGHLLPRYQAAQDWQAGATGYATTAERHCREFVDIASIVGSMAGQYLAWQDKAEARRAEVAQRWSLREAQVNRDAARERMGRSCRSGWRVARCVVGEALIRAGRSLQGLDGPDSLRPMPEGGNR